MLKSSVEPLHCPTGALNASQRARIAQRVAPADLLFCYVPDFFWNIAISRV